MIFIIWNYLLLSFNWNQRSSNAALKIMIFINISKHSDFFLKTFLGKIMLSDYNFQRRILLLHILNPTTFVEAGYLVVLAKDAPILHQFKVLFNKSSM